MSASLPSPYTGVLEDLHVRKIATILGLHVAARATYVTQDGAPGYSYSLDLATAELYAAIRVFEDNVQVESQVLAILRKWDELPLADETGVAEKSRRNLREQLRTVYPIRVEDRTRGGFMIKGR
ncbi:MAG TPA: hypothetical protein VJP77_05640 [Planctomycetota bacterium]|nr:hypothetical protein [Planctomycetota bacterium]